MAANNALVRVREWDPLRGYANLYRREQHAWWGTRRWWINALLWTVMLGGLTAILLFAPSEEVSQATAAEVSDAGGLVAYILSLGLSVFFEFGVPMLGIGTIVLTQDLIIGERQSGVTEWLLSKPVTRRAYVLSKAAAHALPVTLLLVGLPSVVVYGTLSLRLGAAYPPVPYLAGVGLMALHTLFYLSLTILLGTLFTSRAPVLGIALGSVLGGGLLGGFVPMLNHITPWMLPKLAWLTATGQAAPADLSVSAPLASGLWIVTFIFLAMARFERTEC